MTNSDPRRVLGLLLAIVGGGSCGSGQDSNYAITGMLGIPSSTVVGENLVFADAALNGSPDLSTLGMVIDTGSPLVLVDPLFFGLPAPASAADVQPHADLGLVRDGAVAVTIHAVPVLELSAAMMDQLGFSGLVGGDVLRQFSAQLDYAAPMGHGFCLGCPPSPRDDVATPGTSIPFRLRGGFVNEALTLGAGFQTKVTAPPTRIPITVAIEGTEHQFILDTGASLVGVRSDLYQTLTADGRARLDGYPITGVGGTATASVARAQSIAVGDQSVTDVPVMTAPNIDVLLSGVGRESGLVLDGLLGGSFLRNFLVTIDYPGGHLHLQRYNSQTWHDEFKRVGVVPTLTPVTAQHRYAVGFVYPGTDAEAKGLAVGNELTAIDGATLDGLDPITVDQLLDGTPGTTKTLLVASPDTATPVAVSVLVDDLLPVR